MRFRWILALAVCLFPLGRVRALVIDRPYGDASFQFLKLPLSPRSTALGGAGAALVDGIGDADLNPAAAARDSAAVELGQIYTPAAFSATGSQAGWDLPLGNRRLTLHARYLGFGNIPGYDGGDQATGAYGAYTLKLQGGLAGFFWGTAYGVSMAYAQNTIAEGNYATGMVNAGLQRNLPWGFAVGAAVVNADFWTSAALDGSQVFPPTSIQAGVSLTRDLSPRLRVSLAADARTRNDEEIAFPAGVEVSWNDVLWLRAGYPFAEPTAAFSAGMGLRWSRFGFNYAYQGNAVLTGGQFWALEIRY